MGEAIPFPSATVISIPVAKSLRQILEIRFESFGYVHALMLQLSRHSTILRCDTVRRCTLISFELGLLIVIINSRLDKFSNSLVSYTALSNTNNN